ncbi:MAG: hypothetical protein SFV17_12675 [Candidatus Obscuribacter sp.]|nr:hypothetical protein [Candidatus Obscuribacter sp.]
MKEQGLERQNIYETREPLAASSLSSNEYLTAQLRNTPVESPARNNESTTLPALELVNATTKEAPISQSAKDLGAPLTVTAPDIIQIPPPRDPRLISYHIGNGTRRPYYDKYSAGLAITFTSVKSSNPESAQGSSVSVGVGAGYENPNTRVQIYAQPVGSEQRYGFSFVTEF